MWLPTVLHRGGGGEGREDHLPRTYGVLDPHAAAVKSSPIARGRTLLQPMERKREGCIGRGEERRAREEEGHSTVGAPAVILGEGGFEPTTCHSAAHWVAARPHGRQMEGRAKGIGLCVAVGLPKVPHWGKGEGGRDRWNTGREPMGSRIPMSLPSSLPPSPQGGQCYGLWQERERGKGCKGGGEERWEGGGAAPPGRRLSRWEGGEGGTTPLDCRLSCREGGEEGSAPPDRRRKCWGGGGKGGTGGVG